MIYLLQISLSKSQLKGLYDGINYKGERKLELAELYLLNADGQTSELIELVQIKYEKEKTKQALTQTISQAEVLNNQKTFDLDAILKKSKSKNIKEFWMKKLRHAHCSVYLKPLKNENNRKKKKKMRLIS